LAELPSTFSTQALRDHVRWLAAPEREGRGLGTKGLQEAAGYIAQQFQAAGLRPGGENGGWFQTVRIATGPGGHPASGVNVVGYIPGSRGEWQGQSALLTAHYDHLGRGWPDAHAEHAGQVHPGADDNASGVAVLLELARVLGAGAAPPRALVFVAFTAEEADLQGARHFAAQPTPFPADRILGVINLDTVGRLGDGTVSILGAGTASEWPHIFRGASYVTGVPSNSVPGTHEASDQRVFIERGIPAVQVFTGPHADYHRPGDIAEKVDVPGLVKIAALVKEAFAYLGERAEPLTVTIQGAPAPAASSPRESAARRVTFGAVPDFNYSATGVRLSDVVKGSPAEQAGLRAGDVLLSVNEESIASLQQFAQLLRALQPGQRVPVVYTRDGAMQSVTVTVEER
jgi:acetylornithine deacetylase/succinyl-diaminopimelate desuccinylase-like protein